MGEVVFKGAAEFPSPVRLLLAWFQTNGPPGLFRLVLTDTDLRIEGRWLPLRAVLPTRRCHLEELVSARLRGGLVIFYLPNDEWWSIWSFRAETLIRELELRGVSATRDE